MEDEDERPGKGQVVDQQPERPQRRPPVLVADARAARESLGWTPRFADLDTIVAHAWAWERRHAQWIRG